MRVGEFLQGRTSRHSAAGRFAILAFGFALSPLTATASLEGPEKSIGKGESALLRPQRSGRPEALVRAGLDDWTMTMALRALGAGLVLVYAAFVLARWRRRPQEDARARRVSAAVAAIRPGVEEAEGAAIVPRTLPHSPFTDAVDAPTLEGQIEIAAEACVRLSRTIGIIYFEVPGYAQIALRDGKEKAAEIVSALAEALRHHLRVTDHLAVLDCRRIVVCVCLLDKATDLEGIARRLAVIVQRHKLAAGEGAQIRPGLAIYPLNGYSGAELVAAAMRDYQTSPDAPAEEPSPQEAVLDKRPNMRGRLSLVTPPSEAGADPRGD